MPSTSGNKLAVRQANLANLEAVKRLADAHRHELGFVLLPSLREQIEKGEMLVAIREDGLIGFVDYHRRKDRQLTLYHIAVAQENQRQGVGQALMDELVTVARDLGCSQIALKCPTDLGANEFYEQYGFTLAETLNGRLRPLNVWIMPLNLHTT